MWEKAIIDRTMLTDHCEKADRMNSILKFFLVSVFPSLLERSKDLVYGICVEAKQQGVFK